MMVRFLLTALVLILTNVDLLAQIEGKWRGEFTVMNSVKVPFNFEINAQGEVFFINAEERLKSGMVINKGDSIVIPLDQFDNELALKQSKNILEGSLRKQDGTFIAPVKAEKGITYRFAPNKVAAASDLSGKYEVEFQQASGKKIPAIGLFKQKGSKLSATFLKSSGDERYLEGVVDGNKFYLSSFIGSGPGYYQGEFTKDGRISGEQIGTKSRQSFSGKKNDKAALPDAYSLTKVKDSSFNFSFPDINGKQVALSDEKYRNKVVILAITGSWCPNCMDETAFLSPWYKKNRNRGVEIVAIHYERKSDTAFVRKVMNRVKQRFGVEYDQVFGGIATNDSVKASLPKLTNFSSFPTTIFVDKAGKIAKIHTGYSGPATGKYYDGFVRSFNEEIDRLLTKDSSR